MWSFDFWQRWLVFFGIVSMTFSAALMYPTVFNAELSYISSAFWKSGGVPSETKEFYNWVFGVYAAMAAAWGFFYCVCCMLSIQEKRKMVLVLFVYLYFSVVCHRYRF